MTKIGKKSSNHSTNRNSKKKHSRFFLFVSDCRRIQDLPNASGVLLTYEHTEVDALRSSMNNTMATAVVTVKVANFSSQ